MPLIEYKVDARYLITNVVTKEGAYVQVDEVIHRDGHQVVYGRLSTHDIHIFRGVLEFEGRPVCFPMPRVQGTVGAAALAACIKATGGDDGTGRLMGQLRIASFEAVGMQSSPVKIIPPNVEAEPVWGISKQLAEGWRATWFREGWSGRTPNRDGLIGAAIKCLRLYDDVVRDYYNGGAGKLPRWFVNERNAILERGLPKLGKPEINQKLYRGGGALE